MNNNAGLPLRPLRVSNAGVSVKDVFDANGGPAQSVYGQTGQLNQAYEPVIDEEDSTSLRLAPREHVSWSTKTGRL